MVKYRGIGNWYIDLDRIVIDLWVPGFWASQCSHAIQQRIDTKRCHLGCQPLDTPIKSILLFVYANGCSPAQKPAQMLKLSLSWKNWSVTVTNIKATPATTKLARSTGRLSKFCTHLEQASFWRSSLVVFFRGLPKKCVGWLVASGPLWVVWLAYTKQQYIIIWTIIRIFVWSPLYMYRICHVLHI